MTKAYTDKNMGSTSRTTGAPATSFSNELRNLDALARGRCALLYPGGSLWLGKISSALSMGAPSADEASRLGPETASGSGDSCLGSDRSIRYRAPLSRSAINVKSRPLHHGLQQIMIKGGEELRAKRISKRAFLDWLSWANLTFVSAQSCACPMCSSACVRQFAPTTSEWLSGFVTGWWAQRELLKSLCAMI
jgi:hypothetical protein